jgi:Flp pilus assembly protein CpaB
MKRNMVPLLGIAFVVAIISTGVFYGLFAGKLRSSNEIPGHALVVAARDLERGTVIQAGDLRVSEVQGVLSGAFSRPEQAAGGTLLTSMKANEPLLQERLAPPVSEAGGLVPSGMRAVTLHIFQSESLLNLLHPGSRVDLQAVSDRNGATELRNVLESVQVLAVSPGDSNGNRPAGAAVTVLVRARDADMLALADAGSRIRLTLRNPSDEEIAPRRSITLTALFAGSGKLETEAAESGESPKATWDHPIQLHVQALMVSEAAWEEFRARSTELESDNFWRIAAFRSDVDVRHFLGSLERQHQLEVVSGEKLMAGLGRPITYHAGTRADQLRVKFSAVWLNSGKVVLRVRPRIGSSNAADTELPGTSSFFMIDNPVNQPPGQNMAARLFPGRSWEQKRLVIFVSARSIQPSSPEAVARSDRRR